MKNINNTMKTRTKKTEREYIKLVKQIEIQFINSESIDFVMWLKKEKRDKYRPASWRRLRAALVYIINDEEGNEELANIIRNIPPAKNVKKGKTSSTKRKYLDPDDFRLLNLNMCSELSKYDVHIIRYLRLGCHTGLRPSEWPSAVLVGKELHVKNGKNTNGRAHGESRMLDFSDVDSEIIEEIEEHILYIKNEVIDYNKFVDACSKRLRVYSRVIWPRRTTHYTLYSGRHQFSSNLKSAGYTLNEIAAMMGHASNQTAVCHYGKKKRGNGGHKSLPKASYSDLIRVIELNIHRSSDMKENEGAKKQETPKPSFK